MRFAILFLTCDRLAYTRETLGSLLTYNPPESLEGVELLHADDASTEHEVVELAAAAGFNTIFQSRKRLGVAYMTERLIEAAAVLEVDAVLNLQNDWECVRPIPWRDIERLLETPFVYCVRLYGAWKSRTGRCGQHHAGHASRELVQWSPVVDHPQYELGSIHWGHPPAVTLTRVAHALTRGAPTESESRRRSGDLDMLTARTVDNVFFHIGRERTEGFRA